MEHHCHKMLNSLVEICIVVGMDQDTGLVPAYSPEKRQVSKGNDPDSRVYSTMFETNVLAAMSVETASFPHAPYDQINGEPYYPKLGIVGSPTKPANPTKRRRGSILSGCRVKTAELPLGQDVINSLPALCFPDGGFVSKKKKPVDCHSLVLTDIEGTRSYCMCMTFYRGFIIKEAGTIPGAYKVLYLDEKTDQRALQDSSHSICYVPTCCCLISKWPYFNLMKDCLSCVLPKLLTTDARGFRMALMEFVSQLSMVPVPPAGSLGIEFGLYGVSHVVRPAEDPVTETRVINLDLRYPFLSFSLDEVLLLIGCILTQQRIVFLSSSYSLLTPVIESFFTFIQPFSWSWTYVPILPSVLLDLVEAPGAFIMGCHAQHKKQVQRVAAAMDELSGIVIADIDEGTVTPHPNAEIPRLPSFAVSLYKFRMKNAEIHFDRLLLQRQTFFSMEELKREQEKFVRKFQQLVLAATLEMMLRMFGDIKNFIVRQEDLFFDMDSFIQAKPTEDQDFYRVVCKSHAFSTFLYELMHDPEKTDYFTLKAQKTRVAPKAVPLRKRSSSSVARISDEFFVNPQEELNIFVLPPFTFEGVCKGSFYGDYLKSLNEKISGLMEKSSSLLANYLYLRGMLRIACEQDVKAVDDFYGVSTRNVQLFPTKTVQEVLCKMKPEQLGELKTRPFWRKTEMLRTQAKGKKEFRPERKEVITSAVPPTPLELLDFEKHVSRWQIANSQDAGERLFEVLKNTITEVVEPDTFALFYEAFTEASDKARSVTLHDLNPPLEENEYVLKISQMIKTSRGVGYLVLTVKRLLFLENGTHKCTSVIDINDIETVEVITSSGTMRPRGVTAIKITSELDSSKSFVASVKEEKDFWRNCLLEMKAGYEIADALRDSEIIEHAAQNVIMADALSSLRYLALV